MPLIVVRQSAIVANVCVVLDIREKEVSGIIDCLRKRIRNPRAHPRSQSLVERHYHAVIVGIPGTFVARDVAQFGSGLPRLAMPALAGTLGTFKLRARIMCSPRR